MYMRKLAIVLFVLFLAPAIRANNIQVTNVSVLPSTNQIQFDISWDNSWRSDVMLNWDAAWVFFKFKGVDGNWYHLDLSGSGNVLPAGFSYMQPSDNKGVFLYRSSAGSGTASLTGVKIGIPAAYARGVYDIRVFGIEMVYIPTEPFYIGDFGVSAGSYSLSVSSNQPVSVYDNFPTLYDPIANTGMGLVGFPAGYSNFYCMKYELTQGAYRDFLNCLSYNQQINHTSVAPSSATGTAALSTGPNGRPYIEIATPGAVASQLPAVYGCDANNNNIYNEASDGEWVACTYLNWPDKAAYLSWACLAPMSELQFEKICRGPQQPVGGEFAWGNNQVFGSAYTLASGSTASETVTNPASNPSEGNAIYATTLADRPGRNGLFANPTSNRISSGGSFYGVMEMSGNIWETVVTTANAAGRLFTGYHGTGNLQANGYATGLMANLWPGATQVTLGSWAIDGASNATGIIYRGGSMAFPATEMRVSNRTAGNVVGNSPETIRYYDQGCRGVRNL